MMENVSGNQRGAVPFLLFRVRQHLCGLPLAYVVETMRPLPIEAITGAPGVVEGVAVIRGMPLPVLDLGTLLGDGADQPSTRFITVKTGARQVALAVTSVVGLHNLSVDVIRDIPPLLQEAAGDTITAIGALDAEMLMVLNTAHLVPESVWSAINSAGGSS